MPEHYAILEVGTTILLPLNAYRDLDSPIDGFLQDLYFRVDSAVPTDAVFDVRINGVSIWAGDPTQRPKILAGQTQGNKLGINAVIAKNDLIQFDAITVPSGGLTKPFFTKATLYDTIALRGTIIYTTAALNDGATENATIPNMGRTWLVQRVVADRACWVRAYNSNAARVADSGRIITDDASENAGLAMELIFTPTLLDIGPSSWLPVGWNEDDANSTDAIFAITNRSGVNHTVQITLYRLVLER